MQTTIIDIEIPIINPQDIIEHEGEYSEFILPPSSNLSEGVCVKFKTHIYIKDNFHLVQGLYLTYKGNIFTIKISVDTSWGFFIYHSFYVENIESGERILHGKTLDGAIKTPKTELESKIKEIEVDMLANPMKYFKPVFMAYATHEANKLYS